MTKPMTDERLRVVLRALRISTSQISLVYELEEEIRRLREENNQMRAEVDDAARKWGAQRDELGELREETERLKKDKEHWEDGWVDVAILNEKNAKLRKVVETAKVGLNRALTADPVPADFFCEFLEALRKLDKTDA